MKNAEIADLCVDTSMIQRAGEPYERQADVDEFKYALRRLASTVTILTTELDKAWFGMAATAVTVVTLEPPTLLACVNTQAEFFRVVKRRGVFVVNVLSSKQAELCTIFGGAEHGEKRFTYGQWKCENDDVPYLANAQANFFVKLRAAYEVGTHHILVANVARIRASADIEPLVYVNGKTTLIGSR